ncbi:hypothetical protein AXG93_2189s1180 [Marchantia polymorpha subsp. ruderalis]|uniref:DUF7795 domain-containing protein n=1 Tax=Marchantia polymorpha subsp. ruderalis TaxID=1480154 RepID=A0A176WRL9_MARPO|nr:hypothetical protein AXG93_2189s1180 [Marchantia polymorpha subsp. ruderalis]
MAAIEESFKLFMDWVLYLNGLHKLGEQILVEYGKNLEAYRRAKSEEAEYIARVAAAAHSQRLSDFLGPGSWLENTSKALDAKLDSAIARLCSYLKEAHDVLNYLVGISKDAIKDHSEQEVTMQLERFNLSTGIEGGLAADQATRDANQGRISFAEYSSMMALIYKMLEEDYHMQSVVNHMRVCTLAEADRRRFGAGHDERSSHGILHDVAATALHKVARHRTSTELDQGPRRVDELKIEHAALTHALEFYRQRCSLEVVVYHQDRMMVRNFGGLLLPGFSSHEALVKRSRKATHEA